MSWRHILVPTDFSPQAEAARVVALDLAAAFGARITVLHAYHVELPSSLPPMGGGFRMPERVAREIRVEAEAGVERVVRASEGRGVFVDGVAVERPPSSAIVETATDRDVDLIVMGTHGRTGLGRLLLGSVAQSVVARAPCAVLTVGANAS